MNEQLTNVVLSLSSLSNKRIESLSKKVLKKMSFSSSKDLSNLEELCCWLYIYGYVIELKNSIQSFSPYLSVDTMIFGLP